MDYSSVKLAFCHADSVKMNLYCADFDSAHWHRAEVVTRISALCLLTVIEFSLGCPRRSAVSLIEAWGFDRGALNATSRARSLLIRRFTAAPGEASAQISAQGSRSALQQ